MKKLNDAGWAIMTAAAACVRRGNFQNALEKFSSVEHLTADPREIATIALNKAQCDRLLGSFEAAHDECDRALDLSKGNDEDTVDAWIVKAAILVDEGRTADALAVIEASLRLYPAVNQNLQLLRKAELLTSQGAYAEGIPILEQLSQTSDFEESEMATIHHKLGISYGALGNLGNAVQHLVKARSLQLADAYLANNSFWLASIAAGQGHFVDAKKNLVEALRAAELWDPKMLTEIYESLANVSRTLGDSSEAAAYQSLWEASKSADANS